MQVQVIDNLQKFEQIKDAWDAVYSADPHATIYMSWGWLRGWIENKSNMWLVLSAKQSDAVSSYVAFMVISKYSIRKDRFSLIHHLYLGGYPFSGHTGFACLPGHVEEAIPALASYMEKQVKWKTFNLMHVFDPRLDLFLDSFSEKKNDIHEADSTSCPYILLPDSWDQYLQESLGTKTGKSTRKKMQRIENFSEFHVTHVQSDNIEAQIDTLLLLWQDRWGLNPEDTFMGVKVENVLNNFHSIFRHSFESDHLWLDILWDGLTPIAGCSAFIDRKKKLFADYTIAYNKKYSKLSPGLVMYLYCIQYAFENGYKIYDFGPGDEGHKFVFGIKERFSRNIIINRKTFLMRLKNRIPVRVKKLGKTLFYLKCL